MTEQKLLTVRDVAMLLGVSEREVLDLAENGTIPAYKIGGVYLRFKREQVEDYKVKQKPDKNHQVKKVPFGERFSDFFYYYDFYILSCILVLLMLFVIFRV
jgi:excisionase family DNA binding protein